MLTLQIAGGIVLGGLGLYGAAYLNNWISERRRRCLWPF